MKRGIFRGVVWTVGGSAAVAAVSFLRNVLIARVMGPKAFGLWNLCLVSLRLGNLSHLGTLATVAVESPAHRGAGREKEAADLEGRAATATALFGLLAGIVAAVVLRATGGPALNLAAVLLVTSLLLQQIFHAGASILRAQFQFGTIAASQFAFAGVYLVGLLLLLRDYYLTGVLVAGSAGFVLAILLLTVRARDVLPSPRLFGLRRLWPMLVRGFPLYGVHLTFALLLAADRIVVGALLGTGDLGLYGILALAGSALLFLPDAFAGVLWPFAGRSYGESEMRPEALRDMCAQSIRRLALILVPLLPGVLFATELLVVRYLPHFGGSLPALGIYGIGLFPLALSLPLRNLALTIGAGRDLLRIQGLALGVAAAAQIGAALLGQGIVGVAFGAALSFILLFFGTLRLVVKRGVLDAATARTVYVSVVLCFAAAVAIDVLARG